MTTRSPVTLTHAEIEEMLDQAAIRGAERTLASLGLDGGNAAHDIRELRDLLEAWRAARRTAWQTAVKVITAGFLAIMFAALAFKSKTFGS